jgi:anti-sigma B factor antagonist
MHIKVHTYNNMDVAVLELKGNFIGGKETDELREKADQLYDQGNRKLILDLGDVSYLNSSGIGSLMHIYTHYVNGNGRLKLCNISKNIQNAFVITQLVKIFDIEDTQAKALANFGKS